MKKILSVFVAMLLMMTLVACNTEQPTKEPDIKPETKEIQGYTRDSASGTREAFFDIIGIKKDFAETTVGKIQEVSSNGAMINQVENDVNGIGYISLSSLSDKLKPLSYNGVNGTEENVLNDSYKLKRPFNYITKVADQSLEAQIIAALVAFMGTEEGKATIYTNGGIVEMTDQDPSWNDIKDQHPVTALDNSAVTVKFGGSTSVQKVAEALTSQFKTLAGNFNAEHNHTGSGDAFKRTQGSEKDGANGIHMGFLSRAFNLSEESKAENTFGVLAWDAVVVVVHKTNTITNLTTEELKAIYTGERKNW